MLIVTDLRFENIKIKYQSLLWVVGGFSIIVFLMIGGWNSIIYSITNVKWLKSIAQNGVDPQLLFPLGVCGDSKALSLETERNATLPKSPYLAGLAALRIGDLVTAEQLLQRAIDEGVSPNSSPYALGVVYYLQGKDAVGVWRKNADIIRMYVIGTSCNNTGFIDVGDIYYRFVIINYNSTFFQYNTEVYKQLTLHFAKSDDESFNKALKKYISIADQSSTEYFWTLAEAWRIHGNIDKALEYYFYLTKLTPNNPKFLYSIGYSYLLENNFSEAQYYFLKAIQLDPLNPGYYINMGNTYLNQGNFQEAGVWYEKALSVSPKNDWALTRLAKVRINDNQLEDAYSLVKSAMEVNQQADVRALASEIMMKMGNWEKAREYISEAINKDTNNIFYYYQLRDICKSLHDNDCLIETSKRILQLENN